MLKQILKSVNVLTKVDKNSQTLECILIEQGTTCEITNQIYPFIIAAIHLLKKALQTIYKNLVSL